MKYKIRKATSKDLEDLMAFTISEARDAEGIAIPVKDVTRGVKTGLGDNQIAQYWILEKSEGKAVGSISVVREWSDWRGGYYWWIQSLYIVPEHRRKGLFRLMMEEIKKEAKNERALDLRLYVHKENDRAISAYKKVGFCDAEYRIMTMDI